VVSDFMVSEFFELVWPFCPQDCNYNSTTANKMIGYRMLGDFVSRYTTETGLPDLGFQN